MKIKKIRWPFLLMLLVLINSASIAGENQTIRLQLKWHHQFQFAGYYAAIEKGFYDEVGLNVLINQGGGPYDPINAVFEDYAEFGVTDTDILTMVTERQNAIILAAIFQHSPQVLVVSKTSGINHVHDLIGKRIGLGYGATDIYTLLKNEGIGLDNCIIDSLPINLNRLIKGELDAIASYSTNEPYILDTIGFSYSQITPLMGGVDFYGDLLFTRKELFSEQPELIANFRQASLKGWEYAMNHREEIVDLIYNKYNSGKSREHLLFESEKMVRLIANDIVPIGFINPGRWLAIAIKYKEVGLLSPYYKVKGMLYQELLSPKPFPWKLFYLLFTLVIFISGVSFFFYVSSKKLKKEILSRKLVEEENLIRANVLEKLINGDDIDSILESIVFALQKSFPSSVSSILLVDTDKEHLVLGAALGLPEFYKKAINGLKIGPDNCSCGSAAYLKKMVVVQNIKTHPNWIQFKDLADRAKLSSCWSQPIIGGQNNVLGTLAVYSHQPSKPSEKEISTIEHLAKICSLAIGFKNSEELKAKSDNAVRQSESRYRNFISQVSEGVYRMEMKNPMPINLPAEEQVDFFYSNLYVAECNDAFMNMYGLENREEIIGKSQFDLHGGDNNIDNRNSMLKFIHDGYRTENLETKEFDAAGNLMYISNNAVGIIEDGLFLRTWGTQKNITERKITEEKLLKLSFAVDQSPVSIIITKPNGEIEYVNNHFCNITGFTFDEVMGKRPVEVLNGQDSEEKYKNLWDTINSGEVWTGELQNKKKNGDILWESASISPILNKDGVLIYFIIIKEDISQKKKIAEELQSALYKAQESDRLKSAFLANMSHEIRTPMNGIVGFTELLKDPSLTDEEKTEYHDIIDRSSARLLSTINDIIDISKIESNQIELKRTKVNIKELHEFTFSIFDLEAKKKNLHLSYNCELPKQFENILSDHEKLFSILTNLIKNAIKYSSQGDIVFGCRMIKNNGYLEYFVKDEGIGIPEERWSSIFDRFFQVELKNRSVYEGSGLGLAISKAYVEMLGGKIWVESIEGKGSTFYFTIPNTIVDEQKYAIKTKSKTSEKRILPKRNFIILIAEDDEASELLLSLSLKHIAQEILTVSNGEEAVEICKKRPDIDLVLMDVQMPIMNGYEASKKIRLFNPDLLIIAQTAYALTGDRENALAAGCNDYISKPIAIDELIKIINQHIK